jgi:hypothetical protein
MPNESTHNSGSNEKKATYCKNGDMEVINLLL